MAAGGDLHHGLGAAADYALREREREEKVGLVVAAGYLLSLSIGQEGGRDVESWAAHLHVVVYPMYAMRVSFVPRPPAMWPSPSRPATST